MPAPLPMTVLVDRASEDQPWVQAATATGVAGSLDRVYIGNNDFNIKPKTATIDQSLDAATAQAPAGFVPIPIASRAPGAGQNGPSIRPVIHSSGRIYAAYFNWQSLSPASIVTADVVVCRDDNWGQGGSPYTAITDLPAPPGDGLPGVRVAQSVTIPWENRNFLGQERVGSHLSIAVDPNNNNNIVYIAWADYPGGNPPYTLHLRRSTGGGAGGSWSADLRTVPNGINPALAINALGHVGFLYQTLTAGGATWETHIEISTDGFGTAPIPIVLSAVPSNAPVATFLPYLGDYIYLTAVSDTFYGVFSANNTPDLTHFPNGVTYLRNANFATQTLLNVDGTTPVAISIDPFFFTVTDTILPPNWTNLGMPSPRVTITGPVGVLTVMDTPTSPQRPYVFVQGSDGNLWVNWWDGAQWNWTNLGMPSLGVTISGLVGVLTVMDTPTSPQRPCVFVRGSDGNLWVNRWA
jgi:hypothetical protein